MTCAIGDTDVEQRADRVQISHWSQTQSSRGPWLGILPTNHLAVTANNALDARKQNENARFDYVAHWLKTHEENPDKLSFRDVQSAVTTNVRAGSDTVSCALQTFIYT